MSRNNEYVLNLNIDPSDQFHDDGFSDLWHKGHREKLAKSKPQDTDTGPFNIKKTESFLLDQSRTATHQDVGIKIPLNKPNDLKVTKRVFRNKHTGCIEDNRYDETPEESKAREKSTEFRHVGREEPGQGAFHYKPLAMLPEYMDADGNNLRKKKKGGKNRKIAVSNYSLKAWRRLPLHLKGQNILWIKSTTEAASMALADGRVINSGEAHDVIVK